MCRNITELRGLEPPATREEVEAAAWQFVRKVTGVTKPTGATEADMRTVAAEVAELTAGLLDRLPPRRQPPKTPAAAAPPRSPRRLGLEPLTPDAPTSPSKCRCGVIDTSIDTCRD